MLVDKLGKWWYNMFMMTYQRPAIGSVVEVATKWPNIYYYDPNPWEYKVTAGTVVPSNPWDAPDTFCVSTGDKDWPKAVIPMHRVASILYHSGKPEDGKAVENSTVKVLKVEGSKGNVYTVTKEGARYTCTCPGFTFRKQCKHLGMI